MFVTLFPNSSTKNRGGGETFSIWVNRVYKHKHSLVLYTYFPSPLQKLVFSKKKLQNSLLCS